MTTLISKATDEYIARQHGKANHSPVMVIDNDKAESDIRTATRRLNEHRRATVKEHHFLDGEMLKLNGEIRRFETLRLFGLWLLAAAAGLTVVVWLCVTYGLL